MQNDPPQNSDVELPSSQISKHIKPISARHKDVIQPLSSDLHASISNPNASVQPVQEGFSGSAEPNAPAIPNTDQSSSPPIMQPQPVVPQQTVAQPIPAPVPVAPISQPVPTIPAAQSVAPSPVASTPMQVSQPQAVVPQPTTGAAPRPSVTVGSIYPDATKGVMASDNPIPPVNNADTSDSDRAKANSFSFGSGFKIGGSIYIFQLIAAFILSLIISSIEKALVKSSGFSILVLAASIFAISELVIIGLISYFVVKSKDIEDAFWVTIFGVSAQLVIDFVTLLAMLALLAATLLSSGVGSLTISASMSNLQAESIVIDIFLAIIFFFITKFAWGIAFLIFGKIPSRTVAKVIAGAILVIAGGLIIKHYVSAYSFVKNVSQPINITNGTNSGTVNSGVPR